MKWYLCVNQQDVSRKQKSILFSKDNMEYATGQIVLAPTAFEAVSKFKEMGVGKTRVYALPLNDWEHLYEHQPAMPESVRRVK